MRSPSLWAAAATCAVVATAAWVFGSASGGLGWTFYPLASLGVAFVVAAITASRTDSRVGAVLGFGFGILLAAGLLAATMPLWVNVIGPSPSGQ